MKIESIFDFALYTGFTLGVIFIGLPLGIKLTFIGVKCAKLYGFTKVPEHLSVREYAKSIPGVLFLGLFSLVFSIWYLFVDRGGHLFNYISEVGQYFKGL